jgi:ADP-ribose pyrophosphatase YjhB (NUDIX family)
MVIFTVIDNKEDNYRKLPSKQLSVLLVKRSEHPFIDQWALPGGFVKSSETIEESAYRKLFEKTQVNQAHLEQLKVFSEPKRDPRGWIMSCSFIALVENSRLSLASNPDTKLFAISYKCLDEKKEETTDGYISIMHYALTLSNEDTVLYSEIEVKTTTSMYNKKIQYTIVKSDGLAFDHAKIIAYALSHLRQKVNTTPIAFGLLPELFTLTALQNIYEIILDQPLLKANFRRKVANLVIETEEYTQNAGHRPSQLFRRNLEEQL